jgi:pimeloyl-ACP methyl ester carboxylesterase
MRGGFELSGTPLPIYCLHGLLGTCAAHYGRQFRAWQRNHPIVAFDLPGHGKATEDASLPYMANIIGGFQKRMSQYGRGHVVGVSYLGGSVAVRAALEFPELLADLVLTGFVPDVEQEVFVRWLEGFSELAERNRSLVKHYDQIHGVRWRATLDTVLAECRESYALTFAISRSMIAQLRVRTLILNGDLKSEERLAATGLPIQNSLVKGLIIEGAGHMAGYEQPDKFNSIVERFWEGSRVC